MKDTIKVLIVEDEPLIISSLETALNQLSQEKSDLKFKIKTAKNCDTAIYEIDNAVSSQPFDLVLLDISIPKSSDRKYLSGEDLGLK